MFGDLGAWELGCWELGVLGKKYGKATGFVEFGDLGLLGTWEIGDLVAWEAWVWELGTPSLVRVICR